MLGRTIAHRRPRVELTAWADGAVAERLADTVLPAVAHDVVPAVLDAAREKGRGYYDGLALALTADDGAVDLGDGGLTSFTARLLENRKERCLVSCVSTERLAELRASPTS
ncbi:hypothetical protein [Isoptericola hypogeus]|uniref:hypothetical protein n=1 Tax=Isoptericola hypogeus TaxID=300179 RepID=UPI0031DADB69